MILITQFSPVSSEKAGLKEEIFFRITQLSPFQPLLVFASPPRFASQLDDDKKFRRLKAQELEDKAKSNSALFVDTGVNGNVDLIEGDAGLVPATQSQIQLEVERVDQEVEKKRQELSSLIILRREKNPTQAATTGAPTDSLLATKIENAKKGEVLDIAASVGFPYLFLGRSKQSKLKRVLNTDLLELADVNGFRGEQFLTVVCSDFSQIPSGSGIGTLYFFEIDKVIVPSSMNVSVLFVGVDPTTIIAPVECVVTGDNTVQITFRYNIENPPTTDQVMSAFNISRAVDFLDATLVANSAATAVSDEITLPLVIDGYDEQKLIFSGIVTNQNGITTNFPTCKHNIQFVKKPSVVKVRPTNFSKATNGLLFSSATTQAIKEIPLYHAVAGTPILRNSKVGTDVPTLEEYSSLIQVEIPPTIIFAPVTTEQGPVGNFLGNLDLSSLNVTLYDDDGTVMLIQNGEAQAGVSVQYKLHKEPNLEEEIEIGDVDVVIKLHSPPARVPIRGQLIRGVQEIALGVNIATTPSRLTPLGSGAAKTNISEGSIADIATAGLAPKIDKFQDKIGETIKNYSKAPPAKGEYYFNFQAKNAQGQSIDLNKYGTIRLFDEVTFVYLDDKGRPVPLQKTAIVGVIEANNTIAIKDPIVTLPPPKAITLVEIPQTPLNPGRKYRVVVSCTDKGTS